LQLTYHRELRADFYHQRAPLAVGRRDRGVARADRASDPLFGLGSRPALQKDTRTRNVHASTAIEGNPLTLEEGRPIPYSDARVRREVLNYFAGLRYIEKHAHKPSIGHDDIFDLHRVLAANETDAAPDRSGPRGKSGAKENRALYVEKTLKPPTIAGLFPLFDPEYSQNSSSLIRPGLTNRSNSKYRRGRLGARNAGTTLGAEHATRYVSLVRGKRSGAIEVKQRKFHSQHTTFRCRYSDLLPKASSLKSRV